MNIAERFINSMTWNVTYRGKDGRQETIQIEAADRQGVFDELAKRGISAVRVEVANGKLKKRADNSKSGGIVKGLVAGAIVVIAGVASIVYFTGNNGKTGDATGGNRGKIAAVNPAKPKKQIKKVEYTSPEKTGDKLTDALAEVAAAEQALTITQPPKVNIPPGYTNRTFKTGVEQLMSWVFTVEVGDMPMPIPPIGEDDREQLAAILVSKNEIKDSDSEMAAFAKEQVDYAKKEMAEFIKQGGDPDEFLQYYFGQLRHAFEFRNEAQQQYYDLLEEDPELAEEFAKRVNESFDEKGIKHIFTDKEENESEEEE